MSRFIGVESRSAFDNPAIPISSDAVVSLLGQGLTTDSGVHVSEFNALRTSTVWRCASLISGAIAQLPLRPYYGDRDDAGPKRRGPNDTILGHPPSGFTRFVFKETVMLHLLLWGNAYIRKVPNRAGTAIVDWILLYPWQVTPERPKPSDPKAYRISGSNEKLTDEEIIHIPGLGYDGIRGLSPVGFARQTLGLAMAAEQFGASFYGNGALLGGILTSKDRIPQDKADQLKNRWRDKVVGLARAHEVAVLDSGVQYQALSIPPDEAQFLQTRQFSVNDICRWYGVPPHLVGDVDKTTSWGSGIAEQSLGFVRYTVGFWVNRVEQAFDGVLPQAPWPMYAAFDMDRLLRGDAKARSLIWHNAISDGWMSRAEVRNEEELPPAPPEAKLDEFLVSTLEVVDDPAAAVEPETPDEPPEGQALPVSAPGTPKV